MPILLVGLSYQTAPVNLREVVAIGPADLPSALAELKQLVQNDPFVGDRAYADLPNECIILSTCNRLEIYITTRDVCEGWSALEQFIAAQGNVALDMLQPHLYRLEGRAVVEHVMRLASGLDSMVLGESQILAQIGDAFASAQRKGVTGPILSHLFSHALHAGKQARSRTAVSRHSTSISHVAAALVCSKLGQLQEAHVLIVGAGTMARLAARALRARGATQIRCVNRTLAKAELLAAEVQGAVLPWEYLAVGLAWADVVVSAVSVAQPIITTNDLQAAMQPRDMQPLLVVDLAVPRNVECLVSLLPHVQRYDVDDLRTVLDHNIAQRRAAVPMVEAIVAIEVEHFLKWLDSRPVVPLIMEMHRQANNLVTIEITHALRRLSTLDDRGQQVVKRLARRIVNKLLHNPTVWLKLHAATGTLESNLVRELVLLETNQRATRRDHKQSHNIPTATPLERASLRAIVAGEVPHE